MNGLVERLKTYLQNNARNMRGIATGVKKREEYQLIQEALAEIERLQKEVQSHG